MQVRQVWERHQARLGSEPSVDAAAATGMKAGASRSRLLLRLAAAQKQDRTDEGMGHWSLAARAL